MKYINHKTIQTIFHNAKGVLYIQNLRMCIAKVKMYVHLSRVSDTVPLCLYYRTVLVELSGVNDTHYGCFRVPVRANQVPPVTQDWQ